MNLPEIVKELPKWHPLSTYFKENAALSGLINELSQLDKDSDTMLVKNIFNNICEVTIRYTRKENQLFPYLEKYGWNGPSQGMWSFHDENRRLLKEVSQKINENNFTSFDSDKIMIIGELQRMMIVEEVRLLPYAYELLKPEDWIIMRQGEEEIGWAFGITPPSYQEQQDSLSSPSTPELGLIQSLKMEEGYLNLEQLNLILKFLPFDLTYVDEHDRVLFYNRGEERVFPRSPAVIGREVKFCHPPKSVGTVLKILEEFKKGTKSEAKFWINYRGKKIFITYYAIRNSKNEYKGVIEVSQDITEIQTLEGEQRLLDWSDV